MSDELSIDGAGENWSMFSRTPANGKPMFFRSRVGEPRVRAFAERNFFARLRCAIVPDQLTEAGLPKSTAALDAYEDALLRALADAGAQTYLIAVVTGHGIRDLYFTAVDKDELPKAMKSVEGERPFLVSLATGDPALFLKTLTLSPEELQKASYHGVPTQGGGFLGKIFGR